MLLDGRQDGHNNLVLRLGLRLDRRYTRGNHRGQRLANERQLFHRRLIEDEVHRVGRTYALCHIEVAPHILAVEPTSCLRRIDVRKFLKGEGARGKAAGVGLQRETKGRPRRHRDVLQSVLHPWQPHVKFNDLRKKLHLGILNMDSCEELVLLWKRHTASLGALGRQIWIRSFVHKK